MVCLLGSGQIILLWGYETSELRFRGKKLKGFVAKLRGEKGNHKRASGWSMNKGRGVLKDAGLERFPKDVAECESEAE